MNLKRTKFGPTFELASIAIIVSIICLFLKLLNVTGLITDLRTFETTLIEFKNVFSGDGTVYATADKKVLDKLTSLKFTQEGVFTGATTNPISELTVYKNGEVMDTVAMSNVTSFRYTFKETEVFDFGNSYCKETLQ